MNIDHYSLQRALKSATFYKGKIDGDFGPKSRAAQAALLKSLGLNGIKPASRRLLALEQWVMREAGIEVGAIDGFNGPQTRYAKGEWQRYLRDINPTAADVAHQPATFPRQKDMAEFYGKPGTGHVMLDLPYPMRLAWDKSTTVTRTTINEKCAESAGRALQTALDHYGINGLRRNGLDLFGGCYNNRKMRGGSSLSTHAYAAAFDINPAANRLRWGRDRAAMAKKQCAPFLDAFEAEGWVSLGRERNYDWMHVQAARL